MDSEKLLESFDYSTVKMILKEQEKHNVIFLVEGSKIEILNKDKKKGN
jgi:hypothetical protein